MNFLFFFRRLLRDKMILGILGIVPLLIICIGLTLPKSENEPIQIGIQFSDESEFARKVWESLQFYSGEEMFLKRASSQEELWEKVSSREWEIGYIFAENFDQLVSENNFRKCVTRVSSMGSLSGIMSWPIIASILKVCWPDMISQLLIDNDILENSEDAQKILDDFVYESSLVTLHTIPVNEASTGLSAGTLFGATLSRGLIALLLLVISLIFAVRFSEDLSTGFYSRVLPFTSRWKLFVPAFVAIGTLTAIAGLVGIGTASTLIPGFSRNLWIELVALILYLLCLSLFSYVLATWFSPTTILGSLPFVLLICIFFCPLFIDIGGLLPGSRVVSILLPPNAYLHAIENTGGGFWELWIWIAVLCLLVPLKSKRGVDR